MFALSFAVQVTHLHTLYTIFKTHYGPLINSFEGADQTFLQGWKKFLLFNLIFFCSRNCASCRKSVILSLNSSRPSFD